MNHPPFRMTLKSLLIVLGVACSLHGLVAQTSKQALLEARQQQLLDAFMQKQVSLMEELGALKKGGATVDQISQWRKANAARFEEMQGLGEQMSALSAAQPNSSVSSRIPSDASPALRTFLRKQAEIARASSQIEGAQSKGGGAEASRQIAMSSEMKAEIRLQEQRAKEVAAQSPRSLAAPTARIPTNASPELKALLVERGQLARDLRAIKDQYRLASPEEKEAALLRWEEQNSHRIERIQSPQSLADQTKP